MNYNIRLVQKNNGTCDVLIELNKNSTEFGLEFFSKEKIINNYKNIAEFIAKYAKGLKVSTIKILVSGVLIAAIPFSYFVNAASIDDSKYSMAYLYGGTPTQQIEYVERTNNSVQTVSPSYFDINDDGSLIVNPISTDLITYMHSNNIRVVPFLSNHWNNIAGVNALNNIENLSTQLAEYVSQYNLDGINVDIENVTELQRYQYTQFVTLLREKIPISKEVSVAVAANPNGWLTGWQGSYDYTNLAQNSDYLMMMTYDEHYEGGPAGPVASIGFVEDSIKYALSRTSSDKIVVGLPFYGRIWSLNDTSVMGKGISMNTINSMINDYNAVITFDESSQSPKAEFEIRAGDKQYTVGGTVLAPGKYVIWYENDQSIEAKLSLVRKYNLKGVGSWSLGQEDVTIWNDFSKWLNGDPTTTTTSNNILYTVQAGDSLWLISQKFGTTVDAIKTLNNLTSDTVILGQQLKIPFNNTNTADAVVETTAWVTSGVTNLNLRSDASLTSSVITTLNGGTQVTILGSVVNGFYKIRLSNGQTGYVSSTYITTVNPNVTPTTGGTNNTNIITKVTTAKVTVRATASTSSKKLITLSKGTTVTLLGSSGTFSQISYNGIVGYVPTSSLK